MDKKEELLKLLVENNIINQQKLVELNKIASSKKISIENVLLEEKVIDFEDLAKMKAKVYNYSYQNLAEKKLTDNILSIIPIEVAENYKIICFDKQDNKIKVGITNPDDYKAAEAVAFLAKEENLVVEYYLISELSFNIAFKQYKTLRKEISRALKTKAEEEAGDLVQIKEKKGVELEEVAKTAPVAKIISVIIRHAIEGRASDIHIEPLQKDTRVRYRIDGILGTSLILPKNIHSALVGRIKVLANLKLDETRLPQDGRINMMVGEKQIDLRVSTLPLLGQEKVVMRILDMSKEALTLENLGFIGPGLKIIYDSIKKTEGMILVTGPTGSGKSTTLFSMLNKINTEEINISTLEDPVEYYIKGVNQSQVRPEIGFSFSSGLRSLLRQDPDVIMVGEIRDNETAELAVHAGLTGHLVLSTLHTNDAMGAVPRLLDMEIEPFLLGSTLNTIIAQRLVRRICVHCKEEEKLPPDILSNAREEVNGIPRDTLNKIIPSLDVNNLIFYKGAGCSRCGNSGYTNRLVIAEVIDVNDEIKEKIMDYKKIIKLEDIMSSQEFITMKQDGIIKVLSGKTSMEEILRVLYD